MTAVTPRRHARSAHDRRPPAQQSAHVAPSRRCGGQGRERRRRPGPAVAAAARSARSASASSTGTARPSERRSLPGDRGDPPQPVDHGVAVAVHALRRCGCVDPPVATQASQGVQQRVPLGRRQRQHRAQPDRRPAGRPPRRALSSSASGSRSSKRRQTRARRRGSAAPASPGGSRCRRRPARDDHRDAAAAARRVAGSTARRVAQVGRVAAPGEHQTRTVAAGAAHPRPTRPARPATPRGPRRGRSAGGDHEGTSPSTGTSRMRAASWAKPGSLAAAAQHALPQLGAQLLVGADGGPLRERGRPRRPGPRSRRRPPRAGCRPRAGRRRPGRRARACSI